MYDVLNRISVDIGKAYEVEFAVSQPHTQENDLLNRNYASYFLTALLLGRKFLFRCSSASFSTARKMLKSEGADDQIATSHHTKLEEIRFHDLPEE